MNVKALRDINKRTLIVVKDHVSKENLMREKFKNLWNSNALNQAKLLNFYCIQKPKYYHTSCFTSCSSLSKQFLRHMYRPSGLDWYAC